MTDHEERERLAARAFAMTCQYHNGNKPCPHEICADFYAIARLLREPVNARLLEAARNAREVLTVGLYADAVDHAVEELDRAIAAAESAPLGRGWDAPLMAEPDAKPGETSRGPQRAESEPPQAAHSETGEKCQQCGRHYPDVYSIPDDLWARIMPERAPGGLLCPTCCISRLTARVKELEGRIAKKRLGEHMHGVDVCAYCAAGDLAIKELARLRAPRVGVDAVIARLLTWWKSGYGLRFGEAEQILRECWPAAGKGKPT